MEKDSLLLEKNIISLEATSFHLRTGGDSLLLDVSRTPPATEGHNECVPGGRDLQSFFTGSEHTDEKGSLSLDNLQPSHSLPQAGCLKVRGQRLAEARKF
jgi:hypothetical protein